MKRTKKPKKKEYKMPPVWRKKFVKEVYKLALLGLTEKQICDLWEVNIKTFEYWKRTKDDFFEALQNGREIADAKVAHAFYKAALGYSHPDVHILSNRVKEYDKEGNVVKEYNDPLIIPITKHYPPNVYAAHKWLSTRQREYWADIQKSEVDFNININEEDNETMFSDFSTEQLLALEKLGIKQQLVVDNGTRNN